MSRLITSLKLIKVPKTNLFLSNILQVCFHGFDVKYWYNVAKVGIYLFSSFPANQFSGKIVELQREKEQFRSYSGSILSRFLSIYF